VPLLIANRRRRHYSVVMLDREHRLPARVDRDNDGYPVYYYEPTASGFRSLDKPVTEDGITWVPVDSPNGAGWVDIAYLTEAVDLTFFLDDDRPVAMLERLAGELTSRREILVRKDLAGVFSDRGLAVALTNEPEMISPDVLHEALGAGPKSPESQRLWDEVLKPFGAALRAAEELDSRSGHSRTALIPVELWNFEYLSVSAEGHPPWLVYFEYKNGKPRIVGLGVDV